MIGRRGLLYGGAAAAFLVLLHLGWLLFDLGGADATAAFSDLILIPVSLMVAVAAFLRSRRGPRLAWLLVAASGIAWAGGETIWSVYELGLGRDAPFPSTADIGYLAAIPLLVAGVVALSSPRASLGVRMSVESIIVAGSLLFLAWEPLIEPIVAGPASLLERSISVAYPLGDVLIATAAILGLAGVRRRRLPSLSLLAAGAAVMAVTDGAFGWMSTHGTYASGSLIDAGWTLSYVLMGLAAFAPEREPAAVPQDAVPSLRTRSFGSLALPYAAVGVALGFAVQQLVSEGRIDEFLYWTGIGVIVAVLLRQFLFAADNARLARRLAGYTGELEHANRRLEVLAGIVLSSDDTIISTDLEGRITSWNDAATRLFGYTAAEMIGRDGAPLIEDIRPAIEAFVEASRGSVRRFEATGIRKDGARRMLSVTMFPTRGVGGDIIGVSGISRDITEQRTAERVTAEAKARLEAVFAGSPLATLMLDPSGRLQLWNRAAEQIFGWRASEVIGRPPPWLRDEDWPRFRALISEGLRRPQSEGVTLRRPRRDGSIVEIRMWSAPVIGSDGKAVGVMGLMQDVRAELEAARRLRRSEARLAEAEKIANLGSWEWDIASNTVTWSEELYRLYGVTPETFAATYEGFLALVHPDDRLMVEGVVASALETRETFEMEHRVTRPDGAVRWLLGRGRVITDESGNPVRMVGTGQDVTVRKRFEETLRQSEERYRQLFENAVEAVFHTTAEGRMLACNPAFAGILGYGSPEELLASGLRAQQIWADPEARRRYLELLEEHGEVRDLEAQVRRRDGTLLWTSATTRGVRDETGRITELHGMMLDITKRKAAEEALRRSEARFRLLFDSNPHPMWVYDLDTLRFLQVNDAAVVKYGWSREEFLSKHITDIRPPDEIPRLLRELASDRPSLQDSGQWRHSTKDGEIIDVEIASHSFTFEGRPAALVVAFDVTERNRAEEVLRQSEETFRQLLESAPDAVVIVDGDGSISLVNSQTEVLFGYTRGELIGRPVEILVPERLSGVHGGHRTQYLGSPRARPMGAGLDLRGRRKDGSEFPVEISLSPLHTESGTVIFAGVRDVTERTRAAEALRASEERYRELFENANDVVYTLALDGTLTSLNKIGEQMLGYERDEMIGRKIDDFLAPEHLDTTHDMADRKMRGDQQVTTYEIEMVARDGRHVPVEVSSRLIFDAGDPIGIQGIARDITERRNHERELAVHLEELARSNAELERFAYVASHDLREPLRMVSSFVQLLARDYEGTMGPDADEYIAFALDGAARMQQMIDGLLAYSRIGAKEPGAAVDTGAAAEKALANVSFLIEETDAVVTAGPLPVVLGDDVMLVQVFQNLIENAIKFRGDDPPRIHIGAERQDGEWRFTVTDNGIGIDPRHADSIFMLFRRLHGADRFAGTGMGLAICKKIIETHGGRIWVESEPGRGARFHFTLREQAE